MQPSRNFDDLKFSSIHRRILLWGSGGPFLDGYVLVMIGVALEQLTPALKLDADWIGLLGAGTLAGLFVGTSLFGYISDKVGRRKTEYAVGCTFSRTVTSVFHRAGGICTMLKGIRYRNGENVNTASDTASQAALVYIVSNKALSRRRLLCPSCKHRH